MRSLLLAIAAILRSLLVSLRGSGSARSRLHARDNGNPSGGLSIESPREFGADNTGQLRDVSQAGEMQLDARTDEDVGPADLMKGSSAGNALPSVPTADTMHMLGDGQQCAGGKRENQDANESADLKFDVTAGCEPAHIGLLASNSPRKVDGSGQIGTDEELDAQQADALAGLREIDELLTNDGSTEMTLVSRPQRHRDGSDSDNMPVVEQTKASQSVGPSSSAGGNKAGEDINALSLTSSLSPVPQETAREASEEIGANLPVESESKSGCSPQLGTASATLEVAAGLVSAEGYYSGAETADPTSELGLDSGAPLVTECSVSVIEGTPKAGTDEDSPSSDGHKQDAPGTHTGGAVLGSQNHNERMAEATMGGDGKRIEPDPSEGASSSSCPRCGITCAPEEEVRVFGYRTTRWKTANGEESSATRRQSYCRRCRTEHAAEMRKRREHEEVYPDESDSRGKYSDMGGGVATLTDFSRSQPYDASAMDAVALAADSQAIESGRLDLEASTWSHYDSANPGGEQEEHSPLHTVSKLSRKIGGEQDLDGDHPLRQFVSEEQQGVAHEIVPTGGSSLAAMEDDAPAPLAIDVAQFGDATPSPGWRKRSTRYRPPTGGPPPSTTTLTTSNSGPSASRERTTAIEVRVLFERGGYCAISLLARRPVAFPEELTLSSATGSIELSALQDEWYQDVIPEYIGSLLRQGLVWTDGVRRQSWILSGREIFVFASRTDLRGFISCPRLLLGREQLVLCTASRLREVEVVLGEAGCSGWSTLGEADGVPTGWVLLRNVVPRRPVQPRGEADIINVLRPLPEIEIALESGIRLEYNSWLAGYPPAIRVYGDPEHIRKVLIDRQEATASTDGAFTVPGWDALGEHQVWCSGITKTYSMVTDAANSQVWPAYSFPIPGVPPSDGRIVVCGPLVYHRQEGSSSTPETILSSGIFAALATNRVLLGASPGEIYLAPVRLDVRGARCMAYPEFEPVWALPVQPLLCDKRERRISLIGQPTPPGELKSRSANKWRGNASALEQWCRYVLDASRKGLAIEPDSPSTAELWRQYRQRARDIRRSLR